MAGRPKGVPNKNKRHLLSRLEQLYPNYHPVVEMARIAHETEDQALAAQMHKEVAQYVEPKRKAIEVTGENGAPFQVQVIKEFAASTTES